MCKISLVIPFHNANTTLEKTLSRVCRQTMKDMEIICVDDASDDNSLEIVKKRQEEDPRIRIVELKKNGGPGVARNKGMEIAKGEFVAFLDSDDYPDNDSFYENLYNIARDKEADIVKGRYFFSVNNNMDEDLFQLLREDKTYFCKEFSSAIYSRQMLVNNNVKFPSLRCLEDPVFSLRAAFAANKLELSDENRIIVNCPLQNPRYMNLASIREIFSGLEMLSKFLLSKKAQEEQFVYVMSQHLRGIYLESLFAGNYLFEQTVLSGIASLFKFTPYYDKIREKIDRFLENEGISLAEWIHPYFKERLYRLKVATAKVVSFDIFDTFVLRPFFYPADLFKFIESAYGQKYFFNCRIKAENDARRALIVANLRSNKPADYGEVTFDDIYKYFSENSLRLKIIETSMEIKLAQPNPEILEIYRYAKKLGKKVVFTSDMYLPSPVIKKILEKCGADPGDPLYLSSDLNRTKHTGQLYQEVLEKEGIRPEQLLHIGDNYHSDVLKAQEAGISALYYEAMPVRYRRSLSASRFELKEIPSSVVQYAGLMQMDWFLNHTPVLRELTFFSYYAFTLVLAYCLNIHALKKGRNLTDLVFIARDGYLLRKVYEKLWPEETGSIHYIAANRELKRKYYKKDVSDPENNFSRYLSRMKFMGDNIGLVDSIALRFSAQRLLEKYLGKRLLGIYLTSEVNLDLDYVNLTNTYPEHLARSFGWSICEYFLSAPYPSIIDVKNNYIFAEPSKMELDRQKMFLQVEESVLTAIDRYKKFFPIDTPNVPRMIDVMKIFHRLLIEPTEQEKAILQRMNLEDRGKWWNIAENISREPVKLV